MTLTKRLNVSPKEDPVPIATESVMLASIEKLLLEDILVTLFTSYGSKSTNRGAFYNFTKDLDELLEPLEL